MRYVNRIKVTNIEAILAAMNTTELVAEIRLEKNSGPNGIWTHDLCDTGANSARQTELTALHQLS